MNPGISESAVTLLSEPNFAQLGTVNPDGSPHIDTVWFHYTEGELAVATTMATKKARNIAANPLGYVVVTNKANPYEQAQFKVRIARIESDEDMTVCDAIAMRYTGKEFPQRRHKGRVVLYLEVLSCKYHIARV